MSARLVSTALRGLFLVSAMATSIAIAADPGPSRPMDKAASPTTQPAKDEKPIKPTDGLQPPDPLGVVQKALTRLYRVPRKLAQPPVEAAPATSGSAKLGQDSAGAPAGKTGATGRISPEPVQYENGGLEDVAARLPSHTREFSDYQYFGGNPERYGYGRSNHWNGLNGSDVTGEYFRFGFVKGYYHGRWEQQANERNESVLAHANMHLSRGLTHFHASQYRLAAQTFKLAADSNQGDPAARLYAAHSLFAIGRYQEGVQYLRRAFQLQPQIAMLTYDLRDDYGNRTDFNEQLTALEEAQKTSPRNLDRLVMLAYIYGYSGQPDRAYQVLTKAKKVEAGDPLVGLLLANAQPADVMVQEQGQGKKAK